MQVARPEGHILLRTDGTGALIGLAVQKQQRVDKALAGLAQRGQHVGAADGLGGAAAQTTAGGQRAVVTGGVHLVRHGAPVAFGGLGRFVDTLKLGGAADGPVKAAGPVVLPHRVPEVILQLGVLLQPVLQRL